MDKLWANAAGVTGASNNLMRQTPTHHQELGNCLYGWLGWPVGCLARFTAKPTLKLATEHFFKGSNQRRNQSNNNTPYATTRTRAHTRNTPTHNIQKSDQQPRHHEIVFSVCRCKRPSVAIANKQQPKHRFRLNKEEPTTDTSSKTLTATAHGQPH